MMPDDEIIEVVAAHAGGKQIQFNSGERWEDCALNQPGWDFSTTYYRIAPEPLHLISGYCFPKDLHPTPRVGMIKVQQVELEKGENPLRKPREWEVWESPSGALNVVEPCKGPYIATFKVREVIE